MPYIAPPFTPSVTISGTDLIRNTDEKLQTIANEVGDYLETQTQEAYDDLSLRVTDLENDYNLDLKPKIEQKMDDLLGVNPDGTYYTKSAIDALVASKVPRITSTDNQLVRFDGTTGAIQDSGVVIDDSGNLGIGTSSPTKRLEVVNRYTFGQPSSNGAAKLGSLVFDSSTIANGASYTGSGTWVPDSTTFSAITLEPSSIVFMSNTGLTASGAFTPTERMRIDSSGNVGIGVTPSGVAKLQVAGGLKLNNAANTDATTLDWYEEGTFTPTIVGTTTAGVGTYTGVQLGRYTRIGNRVHVHITVQITAHTGTGNLRISGLPFTSNNTTGNYSELQMYVDSLTVSGQPLAVIQPNSTNIDVYACNNGTSVAVALDTSCYLRVTGTYEV